MGQHFVCPRLIFTAQEQVADARYLQSLTRSKLPKLDIFLRV